MLKDRSIKYYHFPSPGNDLSSMKILVGVNRFPVISQRFIYLQVRELLDRGHSVGIVLFGAPERDNPLSELHGFDLPGVQFYSDNLARGKERPSRFQALLRMVSLCAIKPRRGWRALRGEFRRRGVRGVLETFSDAHFFSSLPDADLIHFQFLTIANRGAVLKRYGLWKSEAKMVTSVRGYDITKTAHTSSYDFESLEKYTDGFFPVCDFLAARLEAFIEPAVVKVVPSPAQTNEQFQQREPAQADAPLKILSVGRLVEKKGVMTALKGLAIARHRGLQFTYQVIGEGPQRLALENLVDSLELANCVALSGQCSHAAVSEAMRGADILLVASQQASGGDSEGIPNVIKEAMMIGTLVIASGHAGIPEIVSPGETGFLFDEGSPESLSAAFGEALEKQSSWPAIRERANWRVRDKYAVDRVTETLFAAYSLVGLDVEKPDITPSSGEQKKVHYAEGVVTTVSGPQV